MGCEWLNKIYIGGGKGGAIKTLLTVLILAAASRQHRVLLVLQMLERGVQKIDFSKGKQCQRLMHHLPHICKLHELTCDIVPLNGVKYQQSETL